jgi:hypothetical protein
VIVEFIAAAKESLDIAIQELDSEAIAQAILDARWRGSMSTSSSSRTTCETSSGGAADLPKPGETPEQALFRPQWLEDKTRPGREPAHPRGAPALRRASALSRNGTEGSDDL